ncbi:MAG: hypothetical protein F6K26_38440 [Moorea sp. SIO2I5]|nr:hypothetical protein [Moorena sp. SIO2I5]
MGDKYNYIDEVLRKSGELGVKGMLSNILKSQNFQEYKYSAMMGVSGLIDKIKREYVKLMAPLIFAEEFRTEGWVAETKVDKGYDKTSFGEKLQKESDNIIFKLYIATDEEAVKVLLKYWEKVVLYPLINKHTIGKPFAGKGGKKRGREWLQNQQGEAPRVPAHHAPGRPSVSPQHGR